MRKQKVTESFFLQKEDKNPGEIYWSKLKRTYEERRNNIEYITSETVQIKKNAETEVDQ